MQKAISFHPKGMLVFVALLFSAIGVTAQTSSAKDSVVTVEQLLKLDNAQARANAAKDLAASGLAPTTAADPSKKGLPSKPPEVRANLSVSKIAGVGTNLRADLSYNGRQINDVTVGSRVGPCTLSSIAGQCVALSVAPKPIANEQKSAGLTKAKASNANPSKTEKPTSPLLCPSACWTGAPAFEPARNFIPAGGQGSVATAISGPVLPPSGMPGQTGMSMNPPIPGK